MLKIMQVIFSTMAIILAIYSLVTNDFQYQFYMLLCLSLTAFMMSMQQLQTKKKWMGWLQMACALFILFIAFQMVV